MAGRALRRSADVRDEVGVPGTGPVAFGSFTFDPASDGSVLIVPAVIIGRRSGITWQTTISSAEPAAGRARLLAATPAEVRWSDGSLTAPQWEQVVAAAVARIRAGELRKVVLARDLQAYASAEIDIRVLLARLAARSPGCYTFSCAGLVGATPELLIRREGRQVSSLVLAGTMARGGSKADDEALAQRCSPRPRTPRSTGTRSSRCATCWPRCARSSRSTRRRSCCRWPTTSTWRRR